MTVVQSIVGGVKLQAPANVDNLSPTVVSLLLEGIAQNTSGSVFEAQVMSFYCINPPPSLFYNLYCSRYGQLA